MRILCANSHLFCDATNFCFLRKLGVGGYQHLSNKWIVTVQIRIYFCFVCPDTTNFYFWKKLELVCPELKFFFFLSSRKKYGCKMGLRCILSTKPQTLIFEKEMELVSLIFESSAHVNIQVILEFSIISFLKSQTFVFENNYELVYLKFQTSFL